MASPLSRETLYETASASLKARFDVPENRTGEVNDAINGAVSQYLSEARISAGVDQVLILRTVRDSLRPPLNPIIRTQELLSASATAPETTRDKLKRRAILLGRVLSEATTEGFATAITWGAAGLVGTLSAESALATTGVLQSRDIIEPLGAGIVIYGPAIVATGAGALRGVRQGYKNGFKQSEETILSFVDRPTKTLRLGI